MAELRELNLRHLVAVIEFDAGQSFDGGRLSLMESALGWKYIRTA